MAFSTLSAIRTGHNPATQWRRHWRIWRAGCDIYCMISLYNDTTNPAHSWQWNILENNFSPVKCYSLVPCFGTSFIGTSNSSTEVWHVLCFELARTTLQYGADVRDASHKPEVITTISGNFYFYFDWVISLHSKHGLDIFKTVRLFKVAVNILHSIRYFWIKQQITKWRERQG